MTDPRIAAIRARLEAATKGPWEKRPWHVAGQKSPPKWSISAPGRHIAMVGNANGQTKPAWEADADLIAAAPADLAWLVGEVEREKARADAAEAALATADAAGFARAREDAAKLVERYFNLTGQIVSGTWFDKCKPAARDCAAAIRALLPRVPS